MTGARYKDSADAAEEVGKEFEAHPVSVRMARDFVVRQMEHWRLDAVGWAAGVLVTELASNAVTHARTPYSVALARSADDVLLQVRDGSERLPLLVGGGSKSEAGRGLHVVQAVTRSWGVTTVTGGKLVWGRLALDDGR